jgi:hypothetical protein
MTSLQKSLDTLALLYGAGAAVCRNDHDSLELLKTTELNRRNLWEGVIAVVAQAKRTLGADFHPSMLALEPEDFPVALPLLEAADDWNRKDRESAYLAVFNLSRSPFDPIVQGGAIIGALWKIAAAEVGDDPESYAKRLCLAAGIVSAAATV